MNEPHGAFVETRPTKHKYWDGHLRKWFQADDFYTKRAGENIFGPQMLRIGPFKNDMSNIGELYPQQ